MERIDFVMKIETRRLLGVVWSMAFSSSISILWRHRPILFLFSHSVEYTRDKSLEMSETLNILQSNLSHISKILVEKYA